eukprot:scaffold50322_cov62-Phaeocystis_antarctica.AAC.3
MSACAWPLQYFRVCAAFARRGLTRRRGRPEPSSEASFSLGSWCRRVSDTFGSIALYLFVTSNIPQRVLMYEHSHAHLCGGYSNHLHDSSKPRAVTLPASSPLRQSTSCCSRPHPAPSFSSSIATAPAHAGSSEQYLRRGQADVDVGRLAPQRRLSARQSMLPQAAPSWPVRAGRPHRPCFRHGSVLAEASAHVAVVDVLDQPLERLQLGGARCVRIGRVLRRGK